MPNKTAPNPYEAPGRPQYRVELQGYRIPTMPRIGRSPATEELYFFEGQRDIAITNAAQELASIIPGLTRLYRDLVPEELANALTSFDRAAAEAAAIGFLLKRGYQIVDKPEDA